MEIITLTAIFFLVAIAAKKIGHWFSKFGLPYITGYLLTGMLAGPFILNIMPESSSTTLRFIDELALGIIAFVAGSELYLKEVRSRIKTISWVMIGILAVALPLGGTALFVMTEFIPFTQGMSVQERLAVAILGGTILLALSPASTIAVIQEARAKGRFTRTVLGVTVTMDVVIIVLFAISVAIASSLLTSDGFQATFALLLLIDLGAALVVGYITGRVLDIALNFNVRSEVKIGLILALGYAIFLAAFWLIEFSHDNLPYEIHVEPLLVAVIGGFYVTNYTKHRELFAELLHDISPVVYVAFFTLTGVAIKLDILQQTWPIALGLFAVRVLSIYLGSSAGSWIAKEDASMRRYAWMGLITQAGIALGLAREVANEFPQLGDAFATMVISVVVLNEIFGPMFFKSALRRVGEMSEERTEPDEVRDVLILGIEAQSRELARQLKSHGWQVTLADTDRTHVELVQEENGEIPVYYIPAVTETTLKPLLPSGTDAVVMLLPNDHDNKRACEIAYQLRIPRLIVRPRDLANAEAFSSKGALIVDPTSAMVNLLHQTVRAPQSTAVLLNQDSGREMVQVTVNNPDIEGMLVRDLRLPGDVLLLDLFRDGQLIVPNGYTRLHLRDEITMIGQVASLEEATMKIGY